MWPRREFHLVLGFLSIFCCKRISRSLSQIWWIIQFRLWKDFEDHTQSGGGTRILATSTGWGLFQNCHRKMELKAGVYFGAKISVFYYTWKMSIMENVFGFQKKILHQNKLILFSSFSPNLLKDSHTSKSSITTGNGRNTLFAKYM